MKFQRLLNKEVSSITVSLISAVIFATLFNARIWQIYSFNHPIGSFSNVLSMLCFFSFLFFLMFSIFSIFSFKGLQKVVLSGFFIISAIALYFSISFNILFDESMLQNVIETNTHEAADLLTGIFWIVLLILGVLPSIILYKLRIKYIKHWKQLSLNAVLVAVGFALSFASLYPYYGDMSSFVRNNNKKLSRSLLPTAPVYALYKNLVSKGKEQYIEKQIVDVDAKIKSTQIRHPRKPLAVVVIIGETARASSFILDDAEKLGNKNNLIDEDNLVYFSNFWSCGTNTALSVPCMFSFFTKDDYKREYNKQYENVAELLQRVGYSVTWKENDGGCKGICKTLNNQSIDTEQSQQYSHGNEYYDEALVFDLAEQIHKKSSDQIIFLHQTGSHGPAYFKRVPEKFKKFQPHCESSDFRDCSDQEIQNAYNNTILYTKFVISKAINELKTVSEDYDTALIYLSDHGESTGEKGYYLHGLPYFMAPDEQTHIPALVWMSEGFSKEKMIDNGCIKNKSEDKLSHDNFSHSLLGLLDVECEIYQPELDIFSGCISS